MEEKIGIAGCGRKTNYLETLLALSAMMGNSYINDDMLFPKVKYLRNVPQYMPKKEQGRNDKCNCGSGLKYKKCCGK